MDELQTNQDPESPNEIGDFGSESTDITPDEAMADLSFATMLQDQLMPKMQEEAPQEGMEVPDEREEKMTEMEEKIDGIESTLKEIKESLTKGKDGEIEDLKKQIQDVINNE